MGIKISNIDISRLTALQKYAAKNPFIMGDRNVPEFTCYVPPLTKAIFTHDLRERGRYRHLSVSMMDESKPPVGLVVALMEILGFTGEYMDCHVFISKPQTIEVLERIIPDLPKKRPM